MIVVSNLETRLRLEKLYLEPGANLQKQLEFSTLTTKQETDMMTCVFMIISLSKHPITSQVR